MSIYIRGVALMNAHKYEEAITAFDQAISQRPDYTKAYYNRAVCYMKLENTVRAIESFDEVIRREPANRGALYDLGVLYLKRFEKTPESEVETRRAVICNAIADFAAVAAIDPNDERAQNNLMLARGSLEGLGGTCTTPKS